MKPKDKLKINTPHAELQSYINIMGHVLLQVEEWEEMEGFDGEPEIGYNHTSISLDKKRAIQLRDKLTEFINGMIDDPVNYKNIPTYKC